MKKIFLIDDDADDRDMFREALRLLDAPVEYAAARDGQEGLDILSSPGSIAPDAIFVDLNMPRINGLEFVIRLRQIHRFQKTPVYVYTTSGSPRERVNSITAGATGFIVKHIKLNDLVDELSAVISKLPVSTP
jgi:CheY-like chemotaxis protein